jgi:hypothetical protein
LIGVVAGKVPERHLVNFRFVSTTGGLHKANWVVVNADRAVITVFKLRFLGCDGLDETGLARTIRADDADLATEDDFMRLLDAVNGRMYVARATVFVDCIKRSR